MEILSDEYLSTQLCCIELCIRGLVFNTMLTMKQLLLLFLLPITGKYMFFSRSNIVKPNTYFVTRLGLEMSGMLEGKEGVWMAWWIVWRRMRKIGQRGTAQGF